MSSNSKALSRLAVAIILFSFLAVDITTASTLTVSPYGSKQFTSIQQAVDNAKNNDTIVVYPGTYNEDVKISIDFYKNNLTLEGILFPTLTGKFNLNGYGGGMPRPDINIRGFNFLGNFNEGLGGARITIDNNKFTNLILTTDEISKVNISNNKFQNASIVVHDGDVLIIHNSFISSSRAIETSEIYSVKIKDNTFSKNGYGVYEGFRMDTPGSCYIEDNTFTGNDIGIFCHAQVDTVKNNVFANNKEAIKITSPEKSDIIGNRLELNDIGIDFVPNSRIIYLNAVAQGKIYNNYFNNKVNVAGNLTISKYIWSIDKTRGTNIVGGPYLGGNYWGKPDKSGFSQITKDKNKGSSLLYVGILKSNLPIFR